MHEGVSAPLCFAFIHRVAFEEVSRHEVLMKSVPGKHSLLACGILNISWPNYWSFSFNISLCNQYSHLIPFRIYWFDLLVFQRTLKILLQHYTLFKANSILYTLMFSVVAMMILLSILLFIWFVWILCTYFCKILNSYISIFLPQSFSLVPSLVGFQLHSLRLFYIVLHLLGCFSFSFYLNSFFLILCQFGICLLIFKIWLIFS